MRKLYIISICKKIHDQYSEFHFKGFYNGSRVNKVMVSRLRFDIGEEYLIEVINCKLINSVLYCNGVKSKKLFN
jgi:hypothetical protein